jgi:hypothetical protein
MIVIVVVVVASIHSYCIIICIKIVLEMLCFLKIFIPEREWFPVATVARIERNLMDQSNYEKANDAQRRKNSQNSVFVVDTTILLKSTLKSQLPICLRRWDARSSKPIAGVSDQTGEKKIIGNDWWYNIEGIVVSPSYRSIWRQKIYFLFEKANAQSFSIGTVFWMIAAKRKTKRIW